ncbi:hypothetical protein, partial [Victivallis vadensis]|uniref:hypothetical protein n=1 Tax=Victivallis vadensis TaxID=172901 RepID=UPI0023F9D782
MQKSQNRTRRRHLAGRGDRGGEAPPAAGGIPSPASAMAGGVVERIAGFGPADGFADRRDPA